MRISFILSSFWLSGGVRVVIEYANRLAEHGYQITLVIPKATAAPETIQNLSPKVKLQESRMARADHMNALQLLLLCLSMAKAVPRSDVIISTHTPTTLVGLFAAKLLRKGKLIWLFQDYEEMFEGRPLDGWLMRHALAWHALAVTVSTFCQAILQRYAPGPVIVVGEGLSDAALFHFVPLAQRPGAAEHAVFYLGDGRPRKGLNDFLRAAEIVQRTLPNLKLWIACKESCEYTTLVPHETFPRPSREQLIQLYATCHLFVNASWREGFGLPPLEAMACGAPVVLTDSGGVREYAEQAVNCLMVPPRAPELLAQAMLRVLTDSALAEQLSRNGAHTAQQYQWPAAVARFEHALEQVTGRETGRQGNRETGKQRSK